MAKLKRPKFISDWDIKSPDINLSKNEIREIVKEEGEKLNFTYIFGTPEYWESAGRNIDIELNNLTDRDASSPNFNNLIENIRLRLESTSGMKVKCSTKFQKMGYSESGPKACNVSWIGVFVNAKFSKK